MSEGYNGADATARRRANFNILKPKPGETILDLGCGNGLLALELSRAVGSTGRVLGIDNSQDMLSAAHKTCHDRSNVTFKEENAFALSLPNDSVDKYVSIQVYEYFDDLETPLKEAQRVVKPGGRIVIGDAHWDMVSWYSDDPNRMSHVLELWDHHLADRCVPAKLPSLMKKIGLEFETISPTVTTDTDLRPDGLANMMMILIHSYILSNGMMRKSEIDAWKDEQLSLAAEGRFFFGYVHFSCSGRVR